jgi:rod shape-determining protein MreC
VKSFGRRLFGSCVFILLLWGLVATQNSEKTSVDRFIFNITYPLLVATHSITGSLHGILESRASYAELVAEKARLEKLNVGYEEENIKLHALVNFEKRSRDLAEFSERYNLSNSLLAKILVSHFSDDEQYFILNRGRRDGVTKDMVALYKFQIVGRVTEVFECCSRLLLITDKSCKIAAYTDTGEYHGICKGTNHVNECVLTYIDRLVELKVDDLLFSSGQGLVFPEGYCLGKIDTFESQDLYQQAHVTPLVDFQQLQFCYLLGMTQIPAF